MTLQSRNASAMSRAQAAYDNMTPPEDDGREDYIDSQVELLLDADDSAHVDFFEFAEKADEVLAETDDREFAIVQIVLAVRAGKFELAQKLALRFEDALIHAAEKLVEKALEDDHE